MPQGELRAAQTTEGVPAETDSDRSINVWDALDEHYRPKLLEQAASPQPAIENRCRRLHMLGLVSARSINLRAWEFSRLSYSQAEFGFFDSGLEGNISGAAHRREIRC